MTSPPLFGFLKNRQRTAPKAAREPYTLEAEGLFAVVQRKAIRGLRLRVRPDGSLRVSAPLRLADRDIRAFIVEHQDWIKRQREKLARLEMPPALRYEDGERLPFWGDYVTLRVRVQGTAAKAVLEGPNILALRIPKGASQARHESAVKRWYGRELLKAAETVLPALQESMKLRAQGLRIRSMRSRWGSCNTRSGIITLALALAQKPKEALEYVLVHELAHLSVRSHGKRFKGILDRQLPDWRMRRKRLNNGGFPLISPPPT